MKTPKELYFRRYSVKQLKKIKKSNPKKFKLLYKKFSRKYSRLYKKYVTDMDLPKSHPILKRLDLMDKQLGKFHDAEK